MPCPTLATTDETTAAAAAVAMAFAVKRTLANVKDS